MIDQLIPYLNWRTYALVQGVWLGMVLISSVMTIGVTTMTEIQTIQTYWRAFLIPRKWTFLGVLITFLFPSMPIFILWAFLVRIGWSGCEAIFNLLNNPIFPKRNSKED